MRSKALPPGRLALFGLLSLLDLLLTWWLLRDPDGWVYESNLVARWVLDGYGWPGLAALKTGSVLVVVGLAAVVSRRRPHAGRWVLTFACSAAALVVLYSSLLAGLLEAVPGEERASRMDEEETRWLDSQMRSAQSYHVLRSEVADALLTERCIFSEAIGRLLQSERSRNEIWLRQLRAYYPGYSDEACIAANLMHVVLFSLKDHPASAATVARRLEADFRAYYGKPMPEQPGLMAVPGSRPSLLQDTFRSRGDGHGGGRRAGGRRNPATPSAVPSSNGSTQSPM